MITVTLNAYNCTIPVSDITHHWSAPCEDTGTLNTSWWEHSTKKSVHYQTEWLVDVSWVPHSLLDTTWLHTYWWITDVETVQRWLNVTEGKMLQCRLGVETSVGVQTAGCIQMGGTAGMGHDTHTHHWRALHHTTSCWTQDHMQLSRGAQQILLGGARGAWTVPRPLPLWHGAGLTMLPLPTQCRGHLLLAHTLLVCPPLCPLENVHIFWLSLCVSASRGEGLAH